MNKKLIAAAIAAVVAAPAAVAADTTLYGKFHMSISSNDNGATDNYTVNSNTSRFGIKGSEDLGDGLKAIFKWENQVNLDANNGIAAGRNAYVGLSGGWGTFLVGKHDTPAKVAFYASGTDFLGDSVIDLNSITKGSAGNKTFTEVRANNAIAYISPNFSGVTVAVAMVPGEGGTTSNPPASTDNPANGLADAYSLAVIYGGGGLKVGIGYEVFTGDLNDALNPATTGLSDQKMWQVGASYTFGDFTIGANYEDISDLGGVNTNSSTSWAIAGKANFGNNYVVINYGNYDHSRTGETAANTLDATGFGIGVGHKFSKRTQVYAAYRSTNTDGNAANLNKDTSTFALGMIHTF